MSLPISDFVRLLVDPTRLAVLGCVARGDFDVDELASSLEVSKRDVLEGLGKLRAAGLVTDEGRLGREVLRAVAQDLPQAAPAAAAIADTGEWTPEEAEVLARFFSGSRLSAIPTQQAKRMVVLERLVQEFEPGIRYEEAEVNFTLQMFYADYAALRRYLVDAGFMDRADGVYWRTGGRYPLTSGT